MEIPTYYQAEILDMKPELVPLFLSVLDLNERARQMILTKLINRGMIRSPSVYIASKYTMEEILTMKPELLMTFISYLGLLDNVRSFLLEVLNSLGKIRDTVRFLSGVYQIDYITGTYAGVTRSFYLFYDIHDFEGECSPEIANSVKVSDWLLQKLAEPHGTKFIDFFLEVGPPTPVRDELAVKFFKNSKLRAPRYEITDDEDEIYSEHSLDQLREKLKPCYSPHLFTECPYKDVRVHFVDPREMHYTVTMDNYIQNLKFLIDFFDTDEVNKEHYISYIMRTYIDNPGNKFYQEWSKTPFASEWRSMATQIIGLAYEVNLQSSEEFDLTSTYFKNLKLKYGKSWRTIIAKNPDVARTLVASIGNEIGAIMLSNVVIRATSVLLDIYAIARMFKRFSGEPEYAENILFYAGVAHCIVVKRFLVEVLDFKLKYRAWGESYGNQCIDIKSLPWTF